ncbi:high affinity choline transporter 1-like [Styela clava]
MAVQVPGLISVIVFYVLILVVGIWATRKVKNQNSITETENMLVGGRNMGIFLSFMSLTASWITGPTVNGAAEGVYNSNQGLLWVAPALFGYSLSLVLNGIFFVNKMRGKGYVTLVDPMQAKLGLVAGVILSAVQMVCDLFFQAATLVVLGGTLETISGIPNVWAVLLSSAVCVFYTMFGGLYSIAYTDVIQIVFVVVGLVIAIPFVLTSEVVSSISETAYTGPDGWLGTWDDNFTGSYIDLWLMTLMGGIPIQDIYQKVLGSNSLKNAQLTCILAGLTSCAICTLPVIIGAGAKSANWTIIDYKDANGSSPFDLGDQAIILPLILNYTVPVVVSIIGLGVIAAASMSSLDAALLSTSSVFARNVYQAVIRKKASDRELVWVIRIAVVIVSALSILIALSVNSVLGLLYLAGDFFYCLVFPQFTSVLFLDPNAYGAIPALIVGLILRVAAGESSLDFEPLFEFPGEGNYPFRTVAMVTSFFTLTVFSYIAKFLFERGYIPKKYDFLKSNLANEE